MFILVSLNVFTFLLAVWSLNLTKENFFRQIEFFIKINSKNNVFLQKKKIIFLTIFEKSQHRNYTGHLLLGVFVFFSTKILCKISHSFNWYPLLFNYFNSIFFNSSHKAVLITPVCCAANVM